MQQKQIPPFQALIDVFLQFEKGYSVTLLPDKMKRGICFAYVGKDEECTTEPVYCSRDDPQYIRLYSFFIS